MATQQTFAPCNTSTLALFLASGQVIHNALVAFGWSQTADTGQVNWGTQATVATVFEIWAPTDALQTGASQFFLKLTYTPNQGGGTTLLIAYAIGTGTNGSGTLTGFTITSTIPSSSGYNLTGTLTYECDLSGDTDRISGLLWRNSTVIGGQGVFQCFAVERTKDASGSNTNEGVTLVAGGNGGVFQQTLAFGGAGPAAASTFWVSLGSSGTTGVFNANVPMSPLFPAYGKYANPMTSVATGRSADFTEGAMYTATLYGATRTYVASKAGTLGGTSGASGPGGTANGITLIRYD